MYVSEDLPELDTHNMAFEFWLSQCPVQYDWLSEDQDGQIAYVFHTPKRRESYVS